MVTQQVNNILRHLKQMTMGEMKEHVSKNADQQGNLWCHLEGCRGTCTPYQVNIWGLRKTAANREEGHQMVPQEVQNILRHLKEAFSLLKQHVATNASGEGNLLCHLEGCRGTYTPYRVNIWGLRKTAENRVTMT